MQSKVAVLRALMSVIARRVLGFLLIAAGAISLLVFIGIWALGTYVSAWWWLLLVVFIPWLLIATSIFLVVAAIVRRIYPEPMSKPQQKLLLGFADKIQRLLETRGIGWWVFALQCLKDLLFHRDLTTLKGLIADTTSLRRDFETLEQTLTA